MRVHYVYIYCHTYVYIYVHIYFYMYVYIYVYIYAFILNYTCSILHLRVHLHTFTYTFTFTYICSYIQYTTLHYTTIQYNTIQYNTIQFNTIQYNTIHILFILGWHIRSSSLRQYTDDGFYIQDSKQQQRTLRLFSAFPFLRLVIFTHILVSSRQLTSAAHQIHTDSHLSTVTSNTLNKLAMWTWSFFLIQLLCHSWQSYLTWFTFLSGSCHAELDCFKTACKDSATASGSRASVSAMASTPKLGGFSYRKNAVTPFFHQTCRYLKSDIIYLALQLWCQPGMGVLDVFCFLLLWFLVAFSFDTRYYESVLQSQSFVGRWQKRLTSTERCFFICLIPSSSSWMAERLKKQRSDKVQ